jgi:predicted secreted protein
MKKLWCLLMVFVLCLPMCVFAEGGEEIPPVVEEAWYELSADESVLTVRLPIYDVQNEFWTVRIGNPTVIDLLTCETLGDEEGEIADGQSAMWVASFTSFFEGGSTFMQFTRRSTDGKVLEARIIDVSTADAFVSVLRSSKDSFCYIGDDDSSLFVSLPANATTGYSWSYSLSDADVLMCDEENYISDEAPDGMDGVGGTYVARFSAAYVKSGFVTLTLNYARPWESVQPLMSHSVELFVNEAGLIEFVPAQPTEAFPEGSYDDGYTGISLTKNADGTYAVSIWIYRLTSMDDGVGVIEDGIMKVTITDAAGNKMLWEISVEDDSLKAVVTESTWMYLFNGDEFKVSLSDRI